jgi:hypothetical protein
MARPTCAEVALTALPRATAMSDSVTDHSFSVAGLFR